MNETTQNNLEYSNFKIIKCEGFDIIKLAGALSTDSALDLEKTIHQFTQPPYRHIILNFENASEISKAWIRQLVNLQVSLKQLNKDLRLIQVSESIQASIKNEGVDRLLKISGNLRDALVDLKHIKSKQLDVDFVNPFLDATLQVLKIQTSTLAQVGKMRLKNKNEKFLGDISGIIGIISDSFRGCIIVSFPEKTYLKIASRMFQEEVSSITSDIEDGAGELTNIILGTAKTILNERGYGLKSALPSVVCGENHSVVSIGSGPAIVIPFDTDVGAFYIEISLSE